VLSALSIAAIAVAAFGSTSFLDERRLIMYLAPALWVLAAFVLAPAITPVNSVTFVAVAAYAVAFLLPAIAKGDDSYQGTVAFIVGWAVVPLAWAANLLFLLSLALWRRGSTSGAGLAGAIGFVLALTALAMPNWNGWGPAAGFWLWTAAPGLVALASIVVPRPQTDTIDRAHLQAA
jgi:hypothetical protein